MSKNYGTNHANQLSRVNKIEGQIKGVKKMIESEKYCVDILTQIKAIRSALKSLELSILKAHLGHCLLSTVNSKNKSEATEMIDEILDLLKKTSKS